VRRAVMDAASIKRTELVREEAEEGEAQKAEFDPDADLGVER
jgi:hypothetical protein